MTVTHIAQTKSFFLLSFLILSAFKPSISDDDAKKTTLASFNEITSTDITALPEIVASEITIFGIGFTTSLEKAIEILEENTMVFLEVDPFNNNRYYLYDYEIVNNKHLPLAYFIWDEFGFKLQEVILYKAFSKYLVGRSKDLLTMEVINKHSEVVKDFIGYPSRKETTLDIPSIKMTTFCYYYPDHDFKVIRSVTEKGTSISFGLISNLDF